MAGTLRNMLVLGTVAFLVIMAILVLRSIFFLSSEDSASGDGGDPAGPVAAAPIDGAPVDATGIRCGRPADGSDTAFRVDVAPDLAGEQLVVAVDLVSADGSRESRTVNVPVAETGQGRQVIVPESNDTETFQACVVTIIQQDRKVIMTGR
ncbi:MAG: hypothetical protein ACR2QO_20340 [Acidimicrobiales bacterium]